MRCIPTIHGEPARHALWAAVERAKAGDPLTPVTVTVPSPYAGLALRRELGARAGSVNVRFIALARVAELVGAPVLAAAGRRPLTSIVRAEAVHAVLAADPGPLAAVARHPSTEQRLATTFRELRRAGPSVAEQLRGAGERAVAIIHLYDAFRAIVTDYYDEEDLSEAAARTINDHPDAADELGHLIVYLPTALSLGEGALLRAFAGAERATVVLAATGDHAVDTSITAEITAEVDLPTTEVPTGTAVISAPDPADELRAVTRMIVQRAGQGIPLHRMAIVFRTAAPYARIAREVLEVAGVPWNGPSPRRLGDRLVGRVLLGALTLAEHDFARDQVAGWLASGPVLDPVASRPNASRAVDATRWDALSRRAGVVRGQEQWRERLANLRSQFELELDTLSADPTEPEHRRRRVTDDLEHLQRLDAFVDDLAVRLTPPASRTWSAHAEWARHTIDRYLGPEVHRHDWPTEELDAGRRVLAALEELGGLDDLATDVDAARFRRALADVLTASEGRHGEFGRGVFVGTLRHVYATSFDVIFVVGMNEGSFPPRGREDPLLPDRARRNVAKLPLHAMRRLEERRDYLAALAAAPERVLTFARADPRAQRKRLPARWLIETARARSGRQLSAADLLDQAATPWLHVIESFEDGILHSGVLSPGEPGSVTEHDLAELRRHPRPATHPLITSEPALAAGFAAIAARSSTALTHFDGAVGGGGWAPDLDHPVSPTALQDWATCPFRYFLTRILALREVPKPEELETIDLAERGALMHRILERFVREAPPPAAPERPWRAADRATLRRIAAECCDQVEARGITGRPLLWRVARRRIFAAVEGIVTDDEAVRAHFGALPDADWVEVSFGVDGVPPVVVELGNSRRVAFRGRIDRIDRSADGRRAVVFDYKTGAMRDIKRRLDADPVAGGQLLQLPVYALAAEARLPEAEVSAYYWFTATYERVGYEFDAAPRERFLEVVSQTLDGIDEGCFPAVPGEPRGDGTGRETFHHCVYCPYDRLCPIDRDRLWQRKAADAQPYLALSLDPPP